MKRVVLVIGLILVAGAIFAAGPSGGADGVKTVQARRGDCDNDCLGPLRTQDQTQLKDGSCKDAATATLASSLPGAPDRDRTVSRERDRDQEFGRDRLHDGWEE